MAAELDTAAFDYSLMMPPIECEPSGKNLLSMHQLTADDIKLYFREAEAAEEFVQDSDRRGVALLPFAVMKAVMRQPSTRTGGSCTTAMQKLGGAAELISGMNASAEAKNESRADSWVAFATQSDILGIRTAEDNGPMLAAHAIARAVDYGKLWQTVPVLNLGDGQNEHPTQALGDLYTIYKKHGNLEGLTIAMVGDHERYRAIHSLMIGAATMGMNVVAVESSVAPVPQDYQNLFGKRLRRIANLDMAMRSANVLYVGRNPDEYTGEDADEKARGAQLASDYTSWRINRDRLQQLPDDAMVLHPRPRNDELDPDCDSDHRMYDVEEMANLIPMRMAIIATHLGKSILTAA